MLLLLMLLLLILKFITPLLAIFTVAVLRYLPDHLLRSLQISSGTHKTFFPTARVAVWSRSLRTPYYPLGQIILASVCFFRIPCLEKDVSL